MVDADKRGLTWDVEASERVLRFARAVLRLSEGQFEDQAFEPEPSQAFIVGSLFGWKRANGTRRFRRAYVEQGKGNGKSPLSAWIGLYGLVADGEAGAQIYSAGATKDQAAILFRDAVKMVDKSPSLDAAIERSGGPGREFNLAHIKSGSFFRPVSRETRRTGSGPRPHFALCDELHEHPDGGVIEILERGFKFRRQPLLLMITNSGSDRTSVCWQEREHAIRVLMDHLDERALRALPVGIGTADEAGDASFSYISALDEGEDPLEDPTCWIKANPLLNVTITEEYLSGVVAQAKAIPGKRNGILRLHFCTWTDAQTAWIPRDVWETVEDAKLSIEDFKGARCWIGLDLGAVKDIAGKAYIFEDGKTDDGKQRYALFAVGYTPAETLSQRALNDRAPYDLWAEQGHLIATEGSITRLDQIAADLVEDQQRFNIVAVAYDKWLYKDLARELDALGVTLPVVEHPQGFGSRKDTELRMPDSINALEEMIYEKRIRIGVNPALRSAVAGTTFETSPAGLRRFTKQRATTRIDMTVAAAQAAGAAKLSKPVKQPTYRIY